jgi:4-hydroxythreonine-4-phosphate dehydrogenase
MNKYIFTCGDINGIGPEIVIKTLNKIYNIKNSKFYFVCPKNVFERYSDITKPKFNFNISSYFEDSDNSLVTVIDIGNFKISVGKPTKSSGEAAFEAIKISADLAIRKKIDAIITAPISKTAIKKAGCKYPGHTEMFAEWTNSKKFVMMFLSKKMNASLATIHIPINKVASSINRIMLRNNFEVIIKTLKEDLLIHSPKIAVLGLNPHAGENGAIGKEELEIITPLINSHPFSKYVHGPFSPDAFFANEQFKNYDLILGMYHDQVLIPFKMFNFGAGVNFTAGLPIIRTSPDHGVAYDIAGKNIAFESSMLEAFRYAKIIFQNRNKLRR